MVREEGHYTIKRVDTLPVKGNANFLYALKGSIGEFYRWLPNNTYETISVGGASTDQDNIAKVIEVTSADIAPFMGITIEDRIVQYINSLNYEKLDTDAEIWINYTEVQESLFTLFNISSESGSGCPPQVFQDIDSTAYHNGENEFPVIGDTVYSDALGEEPHPPGEFIINEGLGDSFIGISLGGLVVSISCR